MDTPKFQLVRKGTQLRDSEREIRVEIDPPNPGILRGRFARQKFVVPKKDFLSPIDMDGKALEMRLLGSEKVEIYPEFRLTGVADDGGGARLAQALYHAYEEQIPTVRELLDGIFRSFLGYNPTADEVEEIAARDKPSYQDLKERVARDLGLSVEWSFHPEPKTARWLQSLVQMSPVWKVVTYNEELPDVKLKLAFSVTVVRASISNLDRLQNRAREGLSAAKEFDHIFDRVRKISDPAFRAPWFGVNVWNRDLVRELAADGFAKVLADRLVEELGYVLRFSDIGPQPTEEMAGKFEHATSRHMLQRDYDRAEEVVESLKEDRHRQLKLNGGDFDKVKHLDAQIKEADARLVEARRSFVAGKPEGQEVVQAVEPALLEDLRRKFRAALMPPNEHTSSEDRYAPRS